MPVSDVTPLISYVADGATTSFPFPFQVFQAADLLVVVAGVSAALGTDYTVTVVEGGGSGSVDFLVAKKPLLNQQVDLIRRVPMERAISYTEFGLFHPATVDEDLDRVVMILQQMNYTDQQLTLSYELLTADVANLTSRVVLLENSIAAAINNAGTVIVVNGASGTPDVINGSAALGNQTIDLVGREEVIVSRDDGTDNELKVLDSSTDCTVLRQDYITLMLDETMHLMKFGANWRKI